MGMKMKVGLSVAKGVARRPIRTPVFHQLEASFFVAAYGFEGFAKTAAESGINVSDRALPVVCEITRGVMTEDGTAEADTRIRYDIFAETDMIIYLTADGQMSTRI